VALFGSALRVIPVKAILGTYWKEVSVMHAGKITIAAPNIGQMNTSSSASRIGDWVARVFGCWHTEMSRPFSHQGRAYRVCLNCGAQRSFNLGNWRMDGNLYYERATTSKLYPSDSFAAVKRAA